MPIVPVKMEASIKTGIFSTANFSECAKIIIKVGPVKKMCVLALEYGISRQDAAGIKEFFLNAADKFGAIERLAPGVKGLQEKLSAVECVAVSSGFKAGGKYVESSKALGLNLGTVLSGIKKARAEQIQSEAGTLGIGVESARSTTGTVFDVGYQFGPGNILLKHIVYNLLPFSVGEMFDANNIGHRSGTMEALRRMAYRKSLLAIADDFRTRVIDFIGVNNVGKYEPEVGIAKQILLRSELTRTEREEIFAGIRIALKGDRSAATPGEALSLTIVNADKSDYLGKFWKALGKKMHKEAGKYIPRLRAAAKGNVSAEELWMMAFILHAGERSRVLDAEIAAMDREITAIKELRKNSQEQQAEILLGQMTTLGRKVSALKKEKEAAAETAKFSEEQITGYLSGNMNRPITNYFKDVDDYLEIENREEKRVFTLQKVLDIATGKGGAA